MEIWDAGDGDIIVLGSEHPWQSDSSVYAQALRLPGVRGGLRVIGLTSPVSILSRRLASQRTAFAIAGEGPMQRDSHPLLEYTAPRAFYLYLHRVGVFRILHFDERTWQIRLASDAANNDLSTLEPPELKAIFDSGQGSVNIDMMNYLHAQYNHYTTHAPMHPVVTDNHVMPCSLQGTNKMYGIYTPPSAATNALTHQLASAEYALATDPSKLSAIEDIEYALDATFNYHRQNADWSAAYYADLAVKACLRRQAYDRAKAILLRGLQLEPDSDELHYLSRILIREKILQPDDLSSPPALSYGSAGLVPGPGRHQMKKKVEPNFFIIGAAKAATTSLSSLLAAHPQAGISQPKEPHFFSADANYKRGWQNYLALFEHCASARAIGDASTSYSRIRYNPLVLERLKRHVPNAKIIYMVRHPLERMESAYSEHACTPGGPVFPSINDAVRRLPMIIDSSRYWEVFDAYRQKFSEAKIKIVWFEEYTANTTAVFQDVCRFLEIDDTVVPDTARERTNSRDEAAARLAKLGRTDVKLNTAWDEETRRWVIDQIRDDNCRFLAHFNRPKNHWVRPILTQRRAEFNAKAH